MLRPLRPRSQRPERGVSIISRIGFRRGCFSCLLHDRRSTRPSSHFARDGIANRSAAVIVPHWLRMRRLRPGCLSCRDRSNWSGRSGKHAFRLRTLAVCLRRGGRHGERPYLCRVDCRVRRRPRSDPVHRAAEPASDPGRDDAKPWLRCHHHRFSVRGRDHPCHDHVDRRSDCIARPGLPPSFTRSGRAT